MSPGESKFRQIAAALDCAARDLEAEMRVLGVTVQDRSLRQHERGEYLTWHLELTKCWDLDLETAQVRVRLLYLEPVDASDPPEIHVWRCAERFRPGQLSSVREVAERALPVEALAGSKLGDLAASEMREGAHVLGQAV
jgi:hypothetical protein